MARKWQVTIDCADPDRLVRFWTAALGYVVEPPPEGHATWVGYWRSIGVPDDELPDDQDPHDSIVDPEGVRPRIWFQLVPEPKAGKNRLHIDIDVTDGRSAPKEARRLRVDAEVDRLVSLGATQVRVLGTDDMDYYAVTMLDPEGNEFCLS
jgi:catechol 2,3-dioxygenase-like lactoylglutathione lyase family enzyme